MQPWISLANVIGGLLVMAAAVTDLAAARARRAKTAAGATKAALP